MLRIIGSVCVAAGLAIGCNHENVRAEQQQERNELAQEQTEERQELSEDQRDLNREGAQLAQEQHEERMDLQQDQAEERHEMRAEAREDLVDKTNEVDMGADREELNEDVRELNTLVTQACTGVALTDRSECPLTSDRVASVSNIGDGVRIKLTPVAGPLSTVEERVGCYRARAEIKHSRARLTDRKTPAPMPAPATNACILDQPNLETEISENDGRIQIELTCDNDAGTRALRAQARALAAESEVSENRPRNDANPTNNIIR